MLFINGCNKQYAYYDFIDITLLIMVYNQSKINVPLLPQLYLRGLIR